MNFRTLMASKFFAPLFWTQFLGAFNDNVYKNALVILITVQATTHISISPDILVPLSGGLFILPFFLFSALAGQLADKYEKSKLIRYVKFAEVNIMLLAAIGFYFENIYYLLTVLFLMGCQSSLFGPVKYSILPQHLSEEGLLKGNGIIELGTFLAILLGILVGGIVILIDNNGRFYISALVLSIAVIGWLSSQKIPIAASVNTHLKINWNIFSETWNIIAAATRTRLILGTILAISWFWFIGATLLNIVPLPSFIETILHGKEQVITLLLTLFSIGIGIGSIMAGRSKNLKKGVKWVVIGAIGITIIAIDLFWACNRLVEYHALQDNVPLLGWKGMFQNHLSVHVLIDILLLGVSGGLYIVPLYVILQEHSAIETRSRTIAANNISNALFMVTSTIFCISMLSNGFTIQLLFIMLGIGNLLIFLFLFWQFSGDIKHVLKI